MHPVIRVINLLLVALLAPWLPAFALPPLVLLLFAAVLFEPGAVHRVLRGLRRTRWLLLSLWILYAWFTPGETMIPALDAWSPTFAGVRLGLHRLGVLVAMISAAAVLVGGLAPRELAAALRRLLGGARVPVMGRFADRVGLLFAELPLVQSRVDAALAERTRPMYVRVANLFLQVEEAAGLAIQPEPPVTLPSIPWLQWLQPVCMLAFAAGLAWAA